MKYVCLFIISILLSFHSLAQEYADTVVIYVNNRVELSIALHDYSDLPSDNSILNALEEFKSTLPLWKNHTSYDKAELINYEIGGGLTIEPGDPKIIFIKKGENLQATGVRDKAIIKGSAFIISIMSSDITNIEEASLSDCLNEVSNVLPDQIRWSKTLKYDCSGEQVELIQDQNNELDFLELNAGAGGSLITNSLVPDISAGIGLGLNQKGKYRSPYISTNFLFDFTNTQKTSINNFMNLGYKWGREDNNELFAVEAGYLLVSQGSLFGRGGGLSGKTFKVGMNWSPAKGIVLGPQIYFGGDFRSIKPSIRVGFGF